MRSSSLAVLVALTFVLASCGGGGTTLVGTWRRPEQGTLAEVTLVFNGTPTAGTTSVAVVAHASPTDDPTCIETTHFTATYTVSNNVLSFTNATAGTFTRGGCSDTTTNVTNMPISDDTLAPTAQSMMGTIAVSASQLTITSAGGSVTTLTRL